MSTLDYTDIPRKRLGEALHAARTMIGLHEQEAADALHISVRRLRHWEQGRKQPDASMADAIGATYGLDLGGSIASRVAIVFDAITGGVVVGGHTVPYIPGVTNNDDFLEGYVAVVRKLRGLEPETPIQLRSCDVDVLATVLDLTDEDLERRLAFWMGQPPGSMIGVRHRLVLAAVVIGVLGGATAGAFMADTSSAADAEDSNPGITQTLDDDTTPTIDTDLGTPTLDVQSSIVQLDVVDVDGMDAGLVLDFSGLESTAFGGPNVDLDDDFAGDSGPGLAPPIDVEPTGATVTDTTADVAAPVADAAPAADVAAPVADAAPAADVAAPVADAAPAADDAAQVSGSPTVDDWVSQGLLDEGDVALVDMLDLVADDAGIDSGSATQAGADTLPADVPVADAPGESWSFDGTREWVRQNIDGGWVDGWQGDGVALTGTELWQAADGDTSIDLNGDGPGWFGRSIDTVEGETYEVSFDLSGNPHGQRGIKSLNLSAGDDVSSFSFDTTDISRNDMQWERSTMTFVADGTSTWISFDSTTPGSVGAVIDSISIAPVAPAG